MMSIALYIFRGNQSDCFTRMPWLLNFLSTHRGKKWKVCGTSVRDGE